MEGKSRKNITIGLELKEDQKTGFLTNGFVKKILTNATFHPHGIKVQLETGEIGRVKEIIEEI